MPLLQAVLCLAAAQKLHTVSAPLRLAASSLWGLLGAPRLACSEFTALDVKNIQLTSVTGASLLAGQGARAVVAAQVGCGGSSWTPC